MKPKGLKDLDATLTEQFRVGLYILPGYRLSRSGLGRKRSDCGYMSTPRERERLEKLTKRGLVRRLSVLFLQPCPLLLLFPFSLFLGPPLQLSLASFLDICSVLVDYSVDKIITSNVLASCSRSALCRACKAASIRVRNHCVLFLRCWRQLLAL